jgi:hypothetical protein
MPGQTKTVTFKHQTWGASIALHLVNSQLSGENMAAAVQITEMVNTILNIVKHPIYYWYINVYRELAYKNTS